MIAGALLVKLLEAQGVERVFCVPGESYLAVLDALGDSTIETVVARNEGGASMMAEATGKLTGRPGIIFATRGPGATNASSGVHVAQQDSTPLLLFIGQVARDARGRDAFQEVDYAQFYGGMAKAVFEIDDPTMLPKIVTEAFAIAMQNRPGPVIISLPEDMLYDEVKSSQNIPPKVTIKHPSPVEASIKQAEKMLAEAKKPIVVAGGSVWDFEAIASLSQFAMFYEIPVACSFRRQRLMNMLDPCFAGDLGIAANPALIDRIKTADLVLLLGGRLSEIASQDYTLLEIPKPQMPLIHVYPDKEEFGKVYEPSLAINTSPKNFLDAMLKGKKPRNLKTPLPEHVAYQEWSDAITSSSADKVNLGEVICYLRKQLPPESIIATGAGNYAGWIHRYYHFRAPLSQLAPVSGSMGYGVPAAIAAKKQFPHLPIIAFAGDGCFLMTCQELATAKQSGANIMVIVVDNGLYGTIRMHQERAFPNRSNFTDLVNPDFVAFAQSMGFEAERVTKTSDFPQIFERFLSLNKPALIHLITDPEAITPSTTLTQIRSQSQ